MRRTPIFFLGAVLLATATALSCGSSSTDDGAGAGAAASTGDGGGGNGPASSSGGDGTKVGTSPLLLNEVSASSEWVELVSSAAGDLDVSGFKVADLSKSGGPKLTEAVSFPAGTVLTTKQYILVKGGGLDGGGKACPDGGQTYCFHAAFGISNKKGDQLYLLDPTGKVVGAVTYPASAAMGDAGESWGRIPSGDPHGTFTLNVATPGAANVAK